TPALRSPKKDVAPHVVDEDRRPPTSRTSAKAKKIVLAWQTPSLKAKPRQPMGVLDHYSKSDFAILLLQGANVWLKIDVCGNVVRSLLADEKFEFRRCRAW